MAPRDMSEEKIKWLTYLVYILLVVNSGVAVWNSVELFRLKDTLPNTYVRNERYTCDLARMEKKMDAIENKLDLQNTRIQTYQDLISEQLLEFRIFMKTYLGQK